MIKPPDVFTAIALRNLPFRIDVFWNPDAQEWRWEASSDIAKRGRYLDEIYSAINPIFRRRRLANMREAVMGAVEDGLRKLAGSKKRWGLLQWDGLWHER